MLGEGEESPNSSLKRSPEIHIYETFNIAKFKKGVNAADSHMIKEGKLLTRGGALQRTWMDFARWTGQSLMKRGPTFL